MELKEIAENLKNCSIVTDIYSGNYICNCGRRLSLTDLHFGDFGNSVACICGNRFWITSDEEGTEELLVYEGFDYVHDNAFEIIKQRVYAGIDWTSLKLDENKLREERDSLMLQFPNRLDSCNEHDAKLISKLEKYGECTEADNGEFFSNFSLEDMRSFAQHIEKYCEEKNIIPNYGVLLNSIVTGYNVFELEGILMSLFRDSYLELLLKDGLGFLFEPSFLFCKDLLEKNVDIDRGATTTSKTLRMPKKLVGYIREHRINILSLTYLQSFFKECNVNDFEVLVSSEDSAFEIRDMEDLKRLLLMGYSSHKLNSYAKEIMLEEELGKSEFLMLLRDSLRMSKTAGLDFKMYGKNLRARHDEILLKYKLVRNQALNKSLRVISANTPVEQYGWDYIAIVPSSVYDFEVEAQNQKHCILSYVEDMAAGNTLVVFIRHRNAPEKSHITLEIRNNKVVQAKRFANGHIDEEDRRYLEKLCMLNGWFFFLA